MLIYGKNVLHETDSKKVRRAFISNNNYIEYLRNNNIKYEIVDRSRLDNMVDGRHQGIVLDVYDYEYYKLSDIDSDFIVLLDHIEDPHNLGAIIRTCECAGITNIIIPKDRACLVNDIVMKSSAGALNNVKIIMVSNLNNALNDLKKQNYFIYSADMDGTDYRCLNYDGKKVLVIGNEGNGISKIIKDNSDFIVSIPMYGKINSLNASVSAAILIYGMKR